MDGAACFVQNCSPDTDLSAGWCYPSFEQLAKSVFFMQMSQSLQSVWEKSRKLSRNLLASLSTCSERKLTKRAPLPLFPCCSSRKKTYMYNVADVKIGSRETKSGSFPNNFLTIFSKLLIDFWGANTTGWSNMKPTHAVQTKKIVRHR